MLTWRALAGLAILSLIVIACSGDDQALSAPTSVPQARAAAASVAPELRIGMVINIAAPTADRDQHVRDVLESAISASPPSVIARLESLQIDEPDDVENAVEALRGLGVTVLVTTCDDGTVPGVVDAGLANDMLVLTGCVGLPRPAGSATSDQVIDVGALATSASTAAEVLIQLLETDIVAGEAVDVEALDDQADAPEAAGEGDLDPSIGLISSDLVPDVAMECTSIEGELAPAQVALSSTFTGLVDDPSVVIDGLGIELESVEIVMLCALAPTVGDLTSALRDRGFDGPIVVPWFADEQQWPQDTNNVWIVAPSSRYGDDPVAQVNSLYEVVDEPSATDVVAADTLSILLDAVQRTGSVRPAQLAEVLRDGPIQGLSGTLALDLQTEVTRNYRLLEIVDGTAVFSSIVEN